ncbi:hypothetical protein KBTX_03204 [wastewater metagenome]|uniref:Uncharacterized protein n=3 Tax=root TaxID=1 RepID=A0A5B8RFS0_9ZZZZ|nr:hypothetical protein KBTEX_03204 [uncultured organism]
MIWAQITRQYLAHRSGTAGNDDVLHQAATLAEANGMLGLRLQALWVRRWIANAVGGDEANDPEVEYLIDRSGYSTVDRFFGFRPQ